FAQDQVDASGDHYRVDLWQCSGNNLYSVQHMRVKLSSEFTSSEVRTDDRGSERNTLSAFLKKGTEGLEIDPTKARTATSVYESTGGENKFKSDVAISNSDVILAKTYDNFGGTERRAVSVAHFSGTSINDFRYDQGAYKFQEGGDRNGSNVIEYREPNYLN